MTDLITNGPSGSGRLAIPLKMTERSDHLVDLRALVRRSASINSIRGTWSSSKPYPAARRRYACYVGGAPLLDDLEMSV